MGQLAPRVYLELRRMADCYVGKEGSGRTLQATALVHEVFLRLVEVDSVNWQDRAHFFAVCATMMRRILVDRARARGSAKRGSAAHHLKLDSAPDVASGTADDGITAINEAMEALGQFVPRKEKVVELRFFGGLSVEETAAVLDISPQSVMRDWKIARAWLLSELQR
jgi:RNA polymerase sigma factor (TIGR02999 family)